MWLARTRTIRDMTHETLCSPGRRTMACLKSLNNTSRHELLVEIVKTSCLWLGQPNSVACDRAPANYESVAARRLKGYMDRAAIRPASASARRI